MARLVRFSAMLWLVVAVIASPTARAQTVAIGGVTFSNKGLVGLGRIAHDKKDKFGETFGSLSGHVLDLHTWQRNASGSYSAMLYAQSDRGYVKSGVTTNYRPRRHKFTIAFTPDASGFGRQTQLDLALTDSTLFSEANGTPLTSLDPSPTTAGTRPGFSAALPQAANGRLSLDAEGIVLLPDGSFFVSDEYGPYIYRLSAAGVLLGAIRPPEALIPKRGGQDSFSSDSPGAGQPNASPSQPTSGRENNKGLEGLSLSADGHTLYALMQAATRQDGGSSGAGKSRHARLLAYDVTNPSAPTFTGEWVFPLPLYTDSANAQQVAEQHELVTLSSTKFLVVASDGVGRGADSSASLYRAVLVFDTTGATNIAGSVYDSATTPLAPGGTLAAGIVAATSAVLVDINDAAQLTKFGLNNSSTSDSNTLASKWESLAIAPALDAAAPDDFFLLVGNDNDFSTSSGFQDGTAYSASPNIDTMILVYRVTLPGTSYVPFITTQPTPQTVATGSTVVFSAGATGSPAPTYQWRRDGTDILGATSATLVLTGATAVAGNYSVVATNNAGSTTSNTAALTVFTTNDPGRLTNLSVLTDINASASSFTVATVIGPVGVSGTQALVLRAAGPALVALGVTGTITDPKLDLYAGSAFIDSNDNWGDGAALATAMASVGAFPYPPANSKDAALYKPTLTPGGFSVVVSGVGGATGTALAEIYDATPAGTFTPASPRLINVSVLKQISAGGSITLGFTIGGATTKTVLIRAIGPGLAAFNFQAADRLSDPLLTLFNSSSAVIATNDDWGGDATLASTNSRVGAFKIDNAGSKDSMLLITLPPGGYTARAGNADGTGGFVIVEVYDVP